MAKVHTCITDCKDCRYSTCFTNCDADYAVITCNKTRAVLLIADRCSIDSSDIAIPAFCPLPDFIEPKTD